MATSGRRAGGLSAAHTSATPIITNTDPMSRTKCSFKGPVCGTAAGRL